MGYVLGYHMIRRSMANDTHTTARDFRIDLCQWPISRHAIIAI